MPSRTLNRERLRELADLIEREDRFDLSCYAAEPLPDEGSSRVRYTGELLTSCETVGCVAGWACALAGERLWGLLDQRIWEVACAELGLSHAEAGRLFYAEADSIWAREADALGLKLASSGDVANWSSITAVQAAKVLRQLADGELEL